MYRLVSYRVNPLNGKQEKKLEKEFQNRKDALRTIGKLVLRRTPCNRNHTPQLDVCYGVEKIL